MIQYKTYSINKQIILTSKVLNSYVFKFWNEVFASINQDQKHLMVLCKVKYSEIDGIQESYKTLGPLRRVEFRDLDSFNEYLSERLDILIESYSSNSISEIIFTYIIKDGLVSEKDRLLLQDLSNKELPFHDFNKVKLPISIYPEDYGTIDIEKNVDVNGELIHRFIVINGSKTFRIDRSFDTITNKVTLLGASGLEWTDTKLSNDLFKRDIGKATFYFLDGEMVLVKRQLPAKPFTRLRNKSYIN